MHPVDPNAFEQVMEFYKQPFRCLQSLRVDHPNFEGVCNVTPQLYTIGPIEHVATPAMDWCIFQTTYVAFAHWVQNGQFPDVDLDLKRFRELMDENMLLLQSDTSRRFYNKLSTGVDFLVKGSVLTHRKRKQGRFLKIQYDFADGKAKAESKLTLQL